MIRAARPDPRAGTPRFDRLRPWLLAGLMCLYVARPLWPSESVARVGDGLPLAMLALTLAVAWFSIGLLDERLRVRWGAVDLAVALLVGWNIVAALVSAQHDAARPPLNMLWEWLAMGLLYFLARQWIETLAERRAAIVVMIALATGIAGFGWYQYFVTMPETRARYAADPDGMLQREGLWLPPGSVERELFEQRLASTEPLATFALTNSLAGFLTAWLLCCVAIAVGLRRLSRLAAAALYSLLLIGVCLLLTKSRSAYLATGIGVGLICLTLLPAHARLRWQYAAIALAVIALASAVGLVTGALDWEVLTETPKSLGYRWQYWQSSAQMIADHPWLGVGPGNFGDHYTRYKQATASEEIADPHNMLLELGATAGLPALLAMLAVLWFAVREVTFHQSRSNLAPPARAPHAHSVHWMLGGAVAGFALAALLPWLTGALLEAPLPYVTAAIALVIAALAAWLWFPWIPGTSEFSGGATTSTDQLTAESYLARMTAIAACALAINLLAAGGIAYPAVAGSFWLLLALSIGPRGDRQLALRQPATFVLWGIALASLAACYVTGYQPVLATQSQLALAQREPPRAEEHLLAAVGSDPWGSTAPTALAEYYLQRWQAAPSQQQFQQFEQAIASAVRQRPNQSSLWMRMGDGYLAAYRETGDPRLVGIAIEAYQRAVLLYPHHARERAKLAIALSAQGRADQARQQAQLALDYDAITPHADQKLRPELRDELAAARLIPPADSAPPR